MSYQGEREQVSRAKNIYNLSGIRFCLSPAGQQSLSDRSGQRSVSPTAALHPKVYEHF